MRRGTVWTIYTFASDVGMSLLHVLLLCSVYLQNQRNDLMNYEQLVSELRDARKQIAELKERISLFEQVVNKGNEQSAPKSVFVQNETKD